MKVNKEDDDKMRTTAANVAARAAVGGDDMFSKWQLMAEARQKQREGGVVSASSSHPSKEVTRKLVSTPVRNAGDNQVSEKRGQLTTISTSGKCYLQPYFTAIDTAEAHICSKHLAKLELNVVCHVCRPG